MCGIAGSWGEWDETRLRGMIGRLAHRGPDAEGLWLKAGAGALGHRRLSIMDPEGGDQPILNEDGSAAILANGEIYNFRRLREGLEAGHAFRTRSDSEVALHLFEERGDQMASHLDGMFALAVALAEDLMLARDPVGIKPLYVASPTGRPESRPLYFASELKALADLNLPVREFPPGHCYHTARGWSRFYTMPDRAPVEEPLDETVRSLRRTLEESVLKRLMSDVPLGAFLSGGLDSSVIAAIARRHLGELHTFAVGIEGSRDLEAARTVADYIGSIHHEYRFTAAEVLATLPEILYYLESFDQDLVRSAIPCYFCSRLAAEHVKVILTGEGADELFAGYRYYRAIDDPDALRRELRRSVTALHNVNLQRVDRMTMAHGLEGRVPFLDVAMIERAQRISPHLKLRRDGTGRVVEKWILRKACEDLLPPEIVWRDKEQFDEGSGTVDLLREALREATAGLAAYRKAHARDRLRSPEEAFYHRLLSAAFAHPDAILTNVARWSERGA